MMTRYAIPEGGLNAALDATDIHRVDIRPALEAFIAWQAEHPIVPTDKQIYAIRTAILDKDGLSLLWPEKNVGAGSVVLWAIVEWQRRMWLASGPEVPEGIRDLLCGPNPADCQEVAFRHDADVLEAGRREYERGKAGR